MLIPMMLSPTIFEAQIPGPQIISDSFIPTVFFYEEEELEIKLEINLPWVAQFVMHLERLIWREDKTLVSFSFFTDRKLCNDLFEEIPNKPLAKKLAEYTLKVYPKWRKMFKVPKLDTARDKCRATYCSNCDVGWAEKEVLSEDGKVTRVDREFICPSDCEMFHCNVVNYICDYIDIPTEDLERLWDSFNSNNALRLPPINRLRDISLINHDDGVREALKILGVK